MIQWEDYGNKVVGFEDRLTPTCKGNITMLNVNHWELCIVGGGGQGEFLNYLRREIFLVWYKGPSWACCPAGL